jgi:hypothetical protein
VRKRLSALMSLFLLAAPYGFAKPKSVLPAYVVQARTVTVLIDPDAGLSLQDPQANRVAQKDVEMALTDWGRFSLVLAKQTADLIVVMRRGHDQMVDQTLSDPRQNNRPGVITTTDDSVMVGGQRGRQPDLTGSNANGQQGGQPQTEIGPTEDIVSVYRGDVKDPLNAPAVWRYAAKDGLRPHGVPAVAEFRKAVAEADKAAVKKP